MEGFIQKDSNPNVESNSEKSVYVEVNKELRNIIRELASIDKNLRKSVFDRMLLGPEVSTADPDLLPFFDQVAAVEERYGREYVEEVSTFYVMPEPTD